MILVALAFISNLAWGTPDRYFLNETTYTNKGIETKSHKPAPDLQFKRSNLSAKFNDGDKSYQFQLALVEVGDLANFVQLDAEAAFAASQPNQKLHNWVSQSFRLEKGKVVKKDASDQYTITDLGNGDAEQVLSNYQISIHKMENPDGSLEIHSQTENLHQESGDETLTSVTTQTTSRPVSRDQFMKEMPENIINFLTHFSELNQKAEEINSQIKACATDCDSLKRDYAAIDGARDMYWTTLDPADVEVMAPKKPIVKKPGKSKGHHPNQGAPGSVRPPIGDGGVYIPPGSVCSIGPGGLMCHPRR